MDPLEEVGCLQKERSELESRLLQLGPFVPGSLIKRYTTCGRANCRCQQGEKHGPFWYLSRRFEGRTRLTYVREEKLEEVQLLVERYRDFQRTRQRLREIFRELERLFDGSERERAVKFDS